MFNRLLHPLSVETFFAEYYERKHLLIRRNDRGYYRDVLDCKQLDELLYSSTLQHPAVRVVDNSMDDFPDPKGYLVTGTKRIDPLKFVAHYAEGSTLALAGLHEKLHGLRKLTTEMASFFRHQFQTNIYLTPGNSQGFSPHYDTHDVFILQFDGAKQWRIYDSNIELAVKSMPFEKEEWPVGNIVDEFTLYQGDLLYIPRGIMHDAYCTDGNSGHITLGLTGKTWAEYLAEGVLKLAKERPALRRYPAFRYGDTASDQIEDLLEVCKEVLTSIPVSADIQNELLSTQRPVSKGHFLQVKQLHRLNRNTSVLLREKHQVRLTTEGDELEVKFYNTSLRLPEYCESFFSLLLAQTTPIPIKEIDCDLDEKGMVTLVRELVKAGLLHAEEWGDVVNEEELVEAL